MKRLKLLSLLAIPAVILPVAFATTSCSAYSALNVGYKIIDENSGERKLSELNTPKSSIKDLLWGGKGFNDGNYVLFITHSMVTSSVNFLLNTQAFTKGENPTIDPNFSSSSCDSLYDTITHKNSYTLPQDTQYQYVVLVEEDTEEAYYQPNGQEETTQPCSPFQKYSEKDESFNDKHKKDEYIRNDKAAKAYRELMDTISKLFSGVDAGTAGDFLAIQWVKGYPISSSAKTSAPWGSDTEFATWLTDNDKKGESWK